MLNHQELLKEAYIYASEHSTDPSTQNGALLVDGVGKILVRAANYFPRGVRESEHRWNAPLKYKLVEHAERNAIYEAARLGILTRGLIMICPWAACADCARGIIQSGIREVVVHDKILEATPERWQEEIKLARTMLMEAGVKYTISDAVSIGAPTIRFNGQIFQP